MNVEVTGDELRQILKELGDNEYGGSGAVRIADIAEATQAEPTAIASILAKLRSQNDFEDLGAKVADHETRMRNLEQWKESSKDVARSAEIQVSANPAPEPQVNNHPTTNYSAPENEGSVFDFNTGKWHQYSLEFDRSIDQGTGRKERSAFEYSLVAGFLAIIIYAVVAAMSIALRSPH